MHDEVFRSYLASSKNKKNESKRNHLKIIKSRQFAAFPKAMALVEPSKGALNDPSFRNRSKFM